MRITKRTYTVLCLVFLVIVTVPTFAGNIIVTQGNTVKALALDDRSVLWTNDTGFTVTDVRVIPDGQRSAILATGNNITVAFDGATGAQLWTRVGKAVALMYVSDIYNQLYTDNIKYPYGAPNLGGSPAPDVFLSSRSSSSSTTWLIDSRTGEIIWSRTDPSDTWASQFIPTPSGSYDVMFTSENASMFRVDGATGTTVIWSRNFQHRSGIPVPDITGDGQYDFFAEPSYWNSTVLMLNGATGETVWSKSYGSFDLLQTPQVVQGENGYDVIVSAQGSSAGGIRRYRASDGAIVWDSSSTYSDNTIIGLLRRTDGLSILSGWRHQYKAVALDALTGQILWDNIPADNADFLGIGVPDMTNDGSDDFLALNLGWLRLYDGVTGAEQTWFSPIRADSVAYYSSSCPCNYALISGDSSGGLILKDLRSGASLNSMNLNGTAIGRLDVIDVDADGSLELLATHFNVPDRPTYCFDLPSLTEKWQTDHNTSFSTTSEELDSGVKVWSGDFDNDGELELFIPYFYNSYSTVQIFSGLDGKRENALPYTRNWMQVVYFDPVTSQYKLIAENNPDAFTHYLYCYNLPDLSLAWTNTNVNTWKLGAISTSMIDGLPRIWGGWYGRTLYVADRNGNTIWQKSFGGTYEAEASYAGDLRGDGVEALLVSGTYGTSQIRLDAVNLANGNVLWTFNDTTAYWSSEVIAVQDVNGDGAKDVFIVTTGNESYGKYPKYEAVSGVDGSRLWEHEYPFDTAMVGHARIADIDGDGDLEILLIVNNTIEARDALTGALIKTYTYNANVTTFEIAPIGVQTEEDFLALRALSVTYGNRGRLSLHGFFNTLDDTLESKLMDNPLILTVGSYTKTIPLERTRPGKFVWRDRNGRASLMLFWRGTSRCPFRIYIRDNLIPDSFPGNRMSVRLQIGDFKVSAEVETEDMSDGKQFKFHNNRIFEPDLSVFYGVLWTHHPGRFCFKGACYSDSFENEELPSQVQARVELGITEPGDEFSEIVTLEKVPGKPIYRYRVRWGQQKYINAMSLNVGTGSFEFSGSAQLAQEPSTVILGLGLEEFNFSRRVKVRMAGRGRVFRY